MPILAHPRLTFPFRKQRASSTSSARSSTGPSHQPASVIPPIPPIPCTFTTNTRSKQVPPEQHPRPAIANQNHPSNRSSDTLPSFRRSRQRSFDFGSIKAKVSTVRLRGKSENVNFQSSSSSLVNNDDNDRDRDSGSDLKPLPNRPKLETSLVPTRHTVDLDLAIRPSPKPNLDRSCDHQTVQFDLQVQSARPSESCGQAFGSSPTNQSNSSSASTSPNSPSLPPHLYHSTLPTPSLQLPTIVNFSSNFDSTPGTNLLDNRPHSRASLSENTDTLQSTSSEADAFKKLQLSSHWTPSGESSNNDGVVDPDQDLDVRSFTSPSPRLGVPAERANYSPTNATSKYSARVRPTPSPRSPRNSTSGTEATPSPPQPSHRPPSFRRPALPPGLRGLPRLDSYSLPVSQPGSSAQPSSSSESENQPGPASAEAEDLGEADSETDGISSEDSGSGGPGEQTITSQPHSSRPPDSDSSVRGLPPNSVTRSSQSRWITFESTTPEVADPSASGKTSLGLERLPGQPSATIPRSTTTSYFGSQALTTPASPVEAPGDRARALLLSSPPLSIITNPVSIYTRRPSIGSRRSLSVSDFCRMTGGTSPVASVSSPIEIISDIAQQPSSCNAHDSGVSEPEATKSLTSNQAPPKPPPAPSDGFTALLVQSPSSSFSGPFNQRRQSMYELRPASNDPPAYEDAVQTSSGARHVILPREEEGREGLPNYSCSIHLEGWMPRKMEFRSPGVQAKDRAWKRQYVVLHGTMMRIYRTDPHTHPVPGNDDPYSHHYIQGASSTSSGSALSPPKSGSVTASPLHFHPGRYDSAPSTSLKEVAFAKASHLPTQHNSLQRVYTLQNAESGLAADYLKRKYIVRVRAEGEQFLLQAKDDRGVIDLIEALQAATNVSLDLDMRPLPKFITLPRRRRRRRGGTSGAASNAQNGREIGAEVIAGMIAEAEASHQQHRRARFDQRGRQASGPNITPEDAHGERMADMLAEEQEAYIRSAN